MKLKRRVRAALILMVAVPFLLMFLAVGTTRHLLEESRPGEYFLALAGPPGRVLATLALAGLFGILVACGLVLSRWVLSGIERPVRELGKASERIGAGELAEAVKADYEIDEFRELALSFDAMRLRLLAALGKLKAEDESRRELVAHVSHDLRTPLSVIRGYAEGLRDGIASTPEAREKYVATVLAKAGELEALIEALFSYARLDYEGFEPRLAELDLAAFLETFAGELRLDGRFAAVGFERAGDPGGFACLADPRLLERALGNIAENAAKHAASPRLELRIGLRALGDRLEMAVSDNGRGVPEAELGRLFEPFWRADGSRSSPGTGLGLSIVKRAFESMGGGVKAASAQGGGLAITAWLGAARHA